VFKYVIGMLYAEITCVWRLCIHARGPVTVNLFDLTVKVVAVKGFFLNHPDVEPKIEAALRETVPLVASGAIRVPIAATYPRPHRAKRFVTPSGAERCFSASTERPESST
jgi:NADPH:quinone reductase-like Zn-dependent oxidoreductase